MSQISENQVLQALSVVQDPDLHQNIVKLGFVKNIRIDGGKVGFDIELTTPACPVKDRMKAQAIEAVKAIPGVKDVSVNMTARVRHARPAEREDSGLARVKNAIAVASGKGGVGKSTVAVNLALSLARTGAKIGLMDADVYGPSVPTMLRGMGMPRTQGERMFPLERYGIKFISLGLLAGPATPVIWRGPMASKLVQQFLTQVEWGELDYLIIDLPPGTGDVQLTLTQSAPLTGAVIVTTPQDVAVGVTMRGLKMFEQVQVPILGIIENMSYFQCPHCNGRTEIFRHGGGEKTAQDLGYMFLGAVPLDPALVLAGDSGTPINLAQEGKPSITIDTFDQIAKELAAQVSIVNELSKSVRFVPVEITTDTNHLEIDWADGVLMKYGFHDLRSQCPCAVCVDEWTGEKRLDPATVPAEVKPLDIRRVGRYAIQIVWSDQHATGIYTFDLLRKIGSPKIRLKKQD